MSAKTKIVALLGLVAIVAGRPGLAHEGHAALPTKGASVQGDTVRLTEEARRAIGLELAPVDAATLEETIRVNADVTIPPDAHAFASTRVAGRLVSIAVQPGAVVEAGAELAAIESAELEELALELAQAGARLDLAARERDRFDVLATGGLAAEKDRLAAALEFRTLEAATEAARRRLLAAGVPEAKIEGARRGGEPIGAVPLRAPISGIVIDIDGEIGRFVEPTEHLFEIADLQHVWVAAEVPEDLSASVRPGAEVRATFDAHPGRIFRGTVERRAPEIEPRMATLLALASFDNRDLALKPGLGGEAEIVARRAPDATAAPVAGITVDGGAAFAFVEQSPGVYRKRDLVLGIRSGALVEVKEGLYPGDRIVTAGREQLAGLFTLGVLRLSEAARRNLGLETAEVDVRTVEDVVTAVGSVRERTGARFVGTARIPGKIRRVLANVGDSVEAGAALAEIESLEADRLAIELRGETLALEVAEANLGRVRELAGRGIPAEREGLVAETAAREKRNAIASLRRRLELLGAEPETIAAAAAGARSDLPLILRSPIAGVVRSRSGLPGHVVKPGDAIIDVVSLAPVQLEAAVPQEAIARVERGAPVRLRCSAWPERVFAGTVTTTTHIVDEGTRTLPVLAEIANEDRALVPGMRCEVTISTERAAEVVAVPRAALGREGGRWFVMLAKPDGAFERVFVELGRRDDVHAEVKKGLYPGDRVVVRGVEAVRSALASVK